MQLATGLGGGSCNEQSGLFLAGEVPSPSFGDPLFRGVMLPVMVAIFGWVLHAVVIVGLGLLTGGPSFRRGGDDAGGARWRRLSWPACYPVVRGG